MCDESMSVRIRDVLSFWRGVWPLQKMLKSCHSIPKNVFIKNDFIFKCLNFAFFHHLVRWIELMSCNYAYVLIHDIIVRLYVRKWILMEVHACLQCMVLRYCYHNYCPILSMCVSKLKNLKYLTMLLVLLQWLQA